MGVAPSFHGCPFRPLCPGHHTPPPRSLATKADRRSNLLHLDAPPPPPATEACCGRRATMPSRGRGPLRRPVVAALGNRASPAGDETKPPVSPCHRQAAGFGHCGHRQRIRGAPLHTSVDCRAPRRGTFLRGGSRQHAFAAADPRPESPTPACFPTTVDPDRRDFFRIEKGFTGEVPPDVRHLFVQCCDGEILTHNILELQNLRTLIFDQGTLMVADCMTLELKNEDVFGSIFRRMLKLRVLILSTGGGYVCGTTFSVSASIDELKHLRYFAFPLPGMTNLILPASIAMLYHAQVLDFGNCNSLVFSNVEDMNKLLNLWRLISRTDLNFLNIGKLIWHQMLPIFTVRKQDGYELRQLKRLNKLQGRLQIHGLENLESKDEAIEANIADKERLTELVLV